MAEKFHRENDIIITTKDEVTVEEVSNYLIKNLDNFRQGSQFYVVCGIHGFKDGSLGAGDLDLVDDYHGMFERFHVHQHFRHVSEKIKEKDFEMGTVFTVFSKRDREREGKYVLYESSKSAIKLEFEKMLGIQRPIVLILASCWSHKSEISNILRSSGMFTVLNVMEDRAKITNGRMFRLSQEQQNFFKEITNNLEIKDVIPGGMLYNIA